MIRINKTSFHWIPKDKRIVFDFLFWHVSVWKEKMIPMERNKTPKGIIMTHNWAIFEEKEERGNEWRVRRQVVNKTEILNKKEDRQIGKEKN